MKTTVPSNAEPGQQIASRQVRSRPAWQQQAMAHGAPLAQLAAAVNASPQVQALEQLKGAAHQSLPAQRLINLTGEINSGRSAQWSDIAGAEQEADGTGTSTPPIKDSMHPLPPLQRKASAASQPVAQFELYERGQFSAAAPEVTNSNEGFQEYDTWERLQEGMKMFRAAAGDILEAIEQMPNMVLTLSTSTEIDSIGKTTLKLVDPTGKVRTTEGGQDSSATVQEWSRWLGDPATRVGVVVQVNPNQVFNAAMVAHTLNHEVFLHAVKILDEIKKLKSIKDDKTREKLALRNPDKDHEDFVFGRRKDLIINQSRMILNVIRDNPPRAQQLVNDYKRDWADRREEMLKAAAGALWKGSEGELRDYAIGIIRSLGGDSDADAQAEVAGVRKILSIIDYDFDAHLADVWDKYRIDLQPRIEEPRRSEAVDLSALPTGPKKKEKEAEKKKGK